VPPFIKTKWFKIGTVVALLVALYALAGFWLAPKLVRNAIMKDIPATLGVQPAVGEIRINPFLLHVELKDFSLTDKSGEKLLGFQRFFVDFELSSIWHRAYTFGSIEIAKPFVNAIVAKDGNLNLLELKPKSAPTPPPMKPENSSIPALRIQDFKLSDGKVSYDDRSTPSGFAARLEPLNFELQQFTTGADGGRFTFTALTKLGERFEWHGHLSVQPIESDGEFQIDALQMHTVWDYLEDQLNFLIPKGKFNLNATYKFALRQAPELHVDVQNLSVEDLAVRPRQGDADWIDLPQLKVSDAVIDLEPKRVAVGKVALSGLKVQAFLDASGLNLASLAKSPVSSVPAPPKPAPTGAAASAAPPAKAAPWSVTLREFELIDAAISAEDRTTKPVTHVALTPLTLKAEHASLDLSKPVDVSLNARLDSGGGVSLSGQVVPQPLSANLGVKLDAIELKAAQPYIAQRTSMAVLGGTLSADTQVSYGTGKPALSVRGRLAVSRLHTVDNALRQDFVNLNQLDVAGLTFEQSPDRLAIDTVTAQQAYARVIVEPDTSLNVQRVLAGPGATVIAPGAAGTTAAPLIATAPPAPPKTNKAGKRPATAPAAPALPIVIKKILLQASEADFADLTVQPNFATGIQKLEGSISNLSSQTGTRARIDLKGQVDPYAPVTIAGEANFLSPELYTDIGLDFRNIELSTFNPYSGKFAGYNIAKGKLTTELHYKVVGRNLDATHHIVVDQLEFGEKTESKDAVSLPIKLGVALLKNRDGVIDLNFPLQGSVDDPKLKLGPAIWHAVVNILERAVTAPFALLGSLFGGGPDLQFIDFDAGGAQLDQAGADKIRSLVKAMNDRPQLKIEVPIAAVKDLDGAALVQARLTQQISDQQGAHKKLAGIPFEQLDPATRLDLLQELYQKGVGADAKYPDSVSAIKSKPDQLAAKNDFLTQALRARISVGEAELTALGQQRASAVQQALLKDTGIDPERVFLVANDKAKADKGRVRVELSVR
jgi:hypothetical protein